MRPSFWTRSKRRPYNYKERGRGEGKMRPSAWARSKRRPYNYEERGRGEGGMRAFGLGAL
jgi:hypothetical protein